MTPDASPPGALITAVSHFNAGDFFTCHEVLEQALWRPAPEGADRTFYHGLIQISVGYHHALHGNQVGALRLLARGEARLHQVHDAPAARWLDSPALLVRVAADRQAFAVPMPCGLRDNRPQIRLR